MLHFELQTRSVLRRFWCREAASSPFTENELAELAAKSRLPAMYNTRDMSSQVD